MRVAMFKGEKTASDLASRLFRIRGRGSQTAMKRATEALLKANPRLEDPGKVPVGTLIVIPDTAPPIVPGEEVTSVAFLRSFAAQNIQSAFDSLQQRLNDIETSALEQVKSGADRFQRPEVKRALKIAVNGKFTFPGAAPNLDSASKEAGEIVKNVKTAQDARKRLVNKVRATLSSFAQMQSQK
jgi:hypothetical protein